MQLLVVGIAIAAAGCSSSTNYESATSAALISADTLQNARRADDQSYKIGPTDKLSITVFQVPSLSFEEIVVDAAGRLQFPLLGSIEAAGQTPQELSETLRAGLAAGFIRNPVVNVSVSEASSQKVTVDGAVTEPGVYEMRGRTTLLQAIAMAKGPSRTARLDQVVVFREIEGQPMVALFDLRAIRAAQMPDPVLQRDDVVVVDTSRLSENLQLAIQALPALGAFGYLAN